MLSFFLHFLVCGTLLGEEGKRKSLENKTREGNMVNAARRGQKKKGLTRMYSAMGFQYQTQPNPNINYPFLETLVCESKHGFTVITLTSSAAPDEEPFITTRTLQGGALNAYGIIVRYQSGDFDGPKNTSGGGRGGSGGSTTGGSETGGIQQTSSSGNGNASKDSSLSTGASIGIGAGLGILGLGMVIGAVVLVLKMRKKKERKEVETYGEMSAGHGGSYRYAHNGEVVSEMGHQNQDPVEIEGDFYSKIPGMGNAPAELDGAVRGGGGLKG
ncbi:hypothetical protein CC80DRAFT_76634 [Byssothecium circinans]|uniref:Mid2 domain-containing protein n=1 Tax=Byssothecium circinans TaxID=147558 RepID=A0A6A5TWJ2_9PLEO|nr:hypothetical protein CC80DRAFT_76634 [Byssothecium circinans]